MSLRALAFAALLLGASTSASAQPSASVARRPAPATAARTILFVGNSFTFGDAGGGPELVRPFGAGTVTDLNGDGIGGVPALFKRFTTEAGLDYEVSLETRSGAGLDYHYDNKLALINRPWDVVVLQSYSTLDAAKPGDPTRLVHYSALLVDSLRARNPRIEVHLLATWSRADQTYLPGGHWHGHPIEAMARRVQAGYEAARARSPQVKDVVRVGAAWTRAIHAGFADANPYDGIDGGKVDLWAPDGYHASVYGYYLEALMAFGTITGVDPRTLGPDEAAAREIGITPAQVKALQAIAHEELIARRPDARR
jgi:hypothetical protein